VVGLKFVELTNIERSSSTGMSHKNGVGVAVCVGVAVAVSVGVAVAVACANAEIDKKMLSHMTAMMVNTLRTAKYSSVFLIHLSRELGKRDTISRRAVSGRYCIL
jgi:deoxyinosine 3'endonuclease (endonuclease V)